MSAPRPKVPIAYLMELVVAAAICTVMVRDLTTTPSLSALTGGFSTIFSRMQWIGGAILAGLALTGGLGLAVESLRGRRPSSWGVGRWIWAIASLSLVILALVKAAGLTMVLARKGVTGRWIPYYWQVKQHVYQYFIEGPLFPVAAFGLIALLARTPRDPSPDAREWTGRLYLGFAVLVNLVFEVSWSLAL